MATVPAEATTETYGISDTITGYTIETNSVTDTPQMEPVHDQKNAVVKELQYDTRSDLSITLRGTNKPTAETFNAFGGVGLKWIIDSVEKAGTYNGVQRWNVKAHNYTNCNTVTMA